MNRLLALATGILFAASATTAAETDAAKLAGGTPVPAGTHQLAIKPIAKQSISFTSDADEVIVGTVAIAGEQPLGSLSIDADQGTGSGSISIPVALLSTGNATRDEHMRSDKWLDAAAHPTISLTDVTFTRVEATVWKLDGTLTVHGVAKPLSTLANIRYIPEFPNLGPVVRIKASFDVDIKAHGIDNPYAGGPAVAQVWQADVALLATPVK